MLLLGLLLRLWLRSCEGDRRRRRLCLCLCFRLLRLRWRRSDEVLCALSEFSDAPVRTRARYEMLLWTVYQLDTHTLGM